VAGGALDGTRKTASRQPTYPQMSRPRRRQSTAAPGGRRRPILEIHGAPQRQKGQQLQLREEDQRPSGHSHQACVRSYRQVRKPPRLHVNHRRPDGGATKSTVVPRRLDGQLLQQRPRRLDGQLLQQRPVPQWQIGRLLSVIVQHRRLDGRSPRLPPPATQSHARPQSHVGHTPQDHIRQLNDARRQGSRSDAT
jgi:hypothetical protein